MRKVTTGRVTSVLVYNILSELARSSEECMTTRELWRAAYRPSQEEQLTQRHKGTTAVANLLQELSDRGLVQRYPQRSTSQFWVITAIGRQTLLETEFVQVQVPSFGFLDARLDPSDLFRIEQPGIDVG